MYTDQNQLQNIRDQVHQLAVKTFETVRSQTLLDLQCIVVHTHTPKFDDGDTPTTRFNLFAFNRVPARGDVESLIKRTYELDYQDCSDVHDRLLREDGVIVQRKQSNERFYYITFRIFTMDKTLLRLLDADNHGQHEVCYIITQSGVDSIRTNLRDDDEY